MASTLQVNDLAIGCYIEGQIFIPTWTFPKSYRSCVTLLSERVKMWSVKRTDQEHKMLSSQKERERKNYVKIVKA